jgi:hypothetical protein
MGVFFGSAAEKRHFILLTSGCTVFQVRSREHALSSIPIQGRAFISCCAAFVANACLDWRARVHPCHAADLQQGRPDETSSKGTGLVTNAYPWCRPQRCQVADRARLITWSIIDALAPFAFSSLTTRARSGSGNAILRLELVAICAGVIAMPYPDSTSLTARSS